MLQANTARDEGLLDRLPCAVVEARAEARREHHIGAPGAEPARRGLGVELLTSQSTSTITFYRSAIAYSCICRILARLLESLKRPLTYAIQAVQAIY